VHPGGETESLSPSTLVWNSRPRLFGFPLCSFVPFVVRALVFPISAISAIQLPTPARFIPSQSSQFGVDFAMLVWNSRPRLFGFPLCSFVPFVVRAFVFPISAMTPIVCFKSSALFRAVHAQSAEGATQSSPVRSRSEHRELGIRAGYADQENTTLLPEAGA
jgi:hypothetical protein